AAQAESNSEAVEATSKQWIVAGVHAGFMARVPLSRCSRNIIKATHANSGCRLPRTNSQETAGRMPRPRPRFSLLLKFIDRRTHEWLIGPHDCRWKFRMVG